MEKFALIVAGGTGSRMGADVPKQFLPLAGKPVLMRTMERFMRYGPDVRLVVVLPANQFALWAELCREHRFELKHQLVEGGASRFQSVKNGLAMLPAEGLVFIHDGVRPLVSLQTLKNCEEMALLAGNALPVIPVVESVRLLDGNTSRHADRDRFRLVQTPQTFQLGLIKQAYCQPENSTFTDDASVCEAMGTEINLVAGNLENIKITHPFDLKMAEYLFAGLA